VSNLEAHNGQLQKLVQESEERREEFDRLSAEYTQQKAAYQAQLLEQGEELEELERKFIEDENIREELTKLLERLSLAERRAAESSAEGAELRVHKIEHEHEIQDLRIRLEHEQREHRKLSEECDRLRQEGAERAGLISLPQRIIPIIQTKDEEAEEDDKGTSAEDHGGDMPTKDSKSSA
jgi:hypothetical protein